MNAGVKPSLLKWLLCGLLAGTTLVIYWPVGSFDLIYFDDPLVLTDCPAVQAGLTWAGVKWALTSVVIANWHPVTNLSFLLVSEFFGTAPGAHHLVNAGIHAANVVLLFLLLRRLTKATWRSAVAAAIFAWHPLRVESVAWIVERKDVLGAFFFLLSLLAFIRHLDESKAGNPRARVYYGLSVSAFALSLLSKPMAVTLPFVLLLLDVWPLGRLAAGSLRPAVWKDLVREKWPFFGLMLGFCVTTYWVQHDYAAMSSWEKLGPGLRAANAISSYVAYPAQLFWPVNLGGIYPYPRNFNGTEIVLKAALLLAVSAGCMVQFAQRPWLAIGWCWYLGMALPVIGLVQVGGQAMADRYTYLPLIGPVVALVWTAAEYLPRSRAGRLSFGLATALVLAALVFLTARQLQYWRNTVTLFEHTLAVTADNPSGEFCLAVGLEHQDRLEEAMLHFRIQMLLSPQDYRPHYDLARVLEKAGRWDAAVAEYQTAADIGADANDFIAHINFAHALSQLGRTEAAVAQLDEAIRIKSDSTEALNNLAWTLATAANAGIRNGARAVALAQKACALAADSKTIYLGTLAAAYAEAGNFDDAVATARRACYLAERKGEADLLARNRQLLEQYRRHQPYREPAAP